MLDARWYWCDVSEPPDDEPDWTRVPAERRDVVRSRRSRRSGAPPSGR